MISPEAREIAGRIRRLAANAGHVRVAQEDVAEILEWAVQEALRGCNLNCPYQKGDPCRGAPGCAGTIT